MIVVAEDEDVDEVRGHNVVGDRELVSLYVLTSTERGATIFLLHLPRTELY